MKINKTYSFAFWLALIITLFAGITLFLSAYYFLEISVKINVLLIYLALVFLSTFLITQYRLEKFIYQRIKKIYNNVALLDSTDLKNTSITSDIETLSKEVQKFAENKQKQIHNLTLREGYRREFLGNVSHELKTPLFTVQGYLLTLIDGAMNDKTMCHQYLNRANKGVDRLISIVKDLDLISKLETSDLNLKKEPFNVIELVHSVFELLEMKGKKRNISLQLNQQYEFPIMAIGDVERIEQVLINLIVNSIKYGKTGGIVMISVEAYNSNKLLVKVSDNGEGIKKEFIPRLFERFYRVDQSRSREEGGSGLGLSIVKHIVEAHDEHIFVTSELNKGSTFSFTLEKLGE